MRFIPKSPPSKRHYNFHKRDQNERKTQSFSGLGAQGDSDSPKESESSKATDHPSKRTPVRCEHCKYIGHTKDKCYHLHWFPVQKTKKPIGFIHTSSPKKPKEDDSGLNNNYRPFISEGTISVGDNESSSQKIKILRYRCNAIFVVRECTSFIS